jgi:GNAT superfamily N-acetyltransferase
MKRLVTTTYLEMTAPDQLHRARPPDLPFSVVRAEIPSPELNRFLYTAVGGAWIWYGRLGWDRARWMEYLDRPTLETWVGYARGTPVGYFELERVESDVEIVYFGLLPGFIGKGLGGALLTAAIERGWQMSAARVWVHTCDLDHPAALANYQARGLRIYKVEQKEEDLPDDARLWDGTPA